MKNVMKLVAAATVFAFVFSCAKEQELPVTPVDNTDEITGPVTPGDGHYSLTLSSPETKTSFGDKVGFAYPKKWSVGDKINVNGVESKELTADDGAGTATATFHFDSDISGAAYSVVYPASAYSASGVTIPAVQSTADGSFDPAADIILGYGTDPSSITLSNAVAYLKIKLQKGDYGNFGVKSISVTSTGKKLNGTFAVAGGTAITVPDATGVAAEETVTLNVTGDVKMGDTEKEFLIALAPQTLAGGISVTVTDKQDNTQTMTKSSSTAFAAGQILAQPAFKFQEYVSIKTADDLIAFANACSAATTNYYVIEADIDMAGKTWPAAGTADEAENAFNGVLDGGNKGDDSGYKISNLASTTGAFINHAYSRAIVKNVTLDASCSISYSADVSANCYIGGIVGMSRGVTTNCYNYASISCASTSYSKPIWMGGIVGRLYRVGSVTNCHNKGAISCTPTGGTDKVNIYIGGIIGSIDRTESADTAVIENSDNTGAITANPVNSSYVHIGGAIGWVYTVNGKASKLTITGLSNSGNVTRVNATQNNDHPVLAAGLIGGIHGSTISEKPGEVEITNSHVENCRIQNGCYNNKQGYGTASHTAGFVGVVRGDESSKNISFSNNCYVSDVFVICRRGFAGGFVSWARGVNITDCKVLNSSVRGILAQCWYAGGIAGCAYDATISNCIVTLTKEDTKGDAYDTYTLYANGNGNSSTTSSVAGGIVAQARGTILIENSKAFIKKMHQGTAGKEAYRGWIAGYIDDNSGTETPSLTIKDCAVGGSCSSAPAVTLDGTNFSSYLYGSKGEKGSVSVTGTNTYWDGTI